MEDAIAYIKSLRWKYAKTMPKHPHEYTLKKWNPDKINQFESFVMLIREQGYDEFFYRKKLRYLNIQGYKYWTMGDHLNKTILINRAKINNEDIPKHKRLR